MPVPEKLPTFKTEHFKFYRVEIDQRPRNLPIALKGQFEPPRALPRRHKVILLTHFGVPVSKNQIRIRNRRTHLSCYGLAGAQEPSRTVGVINQFGKDVLTLGNPEFLLAPAVKQAGDKPQPADLPGDVSHFKVYRILKHGEFQPRTVSLQDQFDREPVKFKVDAPIYFCVPVEKTVGEKKWPVVNPEEHLVMYPIVPRSYDVKKPVWDQFEGGLLRNFRAYFLAVPTLKAVVKRGFVARLDF
jgi:hypothetical protein